MTDAYTALVLSLPSKNKTVRMRIWRALRALGCGVLRDGVYLLPADAPAAPKLAELEAQVKSAGGAATRVEMRASEEPEALRKLFDRTQNYGALIAQIRSSAKKGSVAAAQRLRRAMDEIARIDFYPGEARRQALEALATFESSFSPGEPNQAQAPVRRADYMKYRGRVWATRRSPWVDRLASAWLIKRFIDRRARFKWIGKPKDCPKSAVGFDFDGAEFTHLGERVTFEVLLASFGLEGDPALSRLAATVHFLDVGGVPVAEAGGLEAILKGARGSARSDDELAQAAATVFDHVYSAYKNESDRR